MAEEITLATADGTAAVGRRLSLPADEALCLVLPPTRKLDRVTLMLRAADDSRTPTEGLLLSTDVGAFPPPAGQAARWVAARWSGERAVVAVRLDASGGAKAGARLKLLSAGVWLPLSPVDVIRLDAAQGFPAMAAEQLMAELLVENVIDGKPTGVLVPGALPVSALSVTTTRQPCRLAVAIADDPPFFTHPGPLPVIPIAVEGLTRAANRWLVDHPRANAVPLTLLAAAPADVTVETFSASLRPLPGVPGAGSGGTADASGTVVETRDERMLTAPLRLRRGQGQWCTPSHHAAQAFAPLREDAALSSLRLALHAVGGPCAGELTLCADAHGRPADTGLAGGTVAFTAEPPPDGAASGNDERSFPACRLPDPVRPPPGRWWVVCRLSAGEAVWYASEEAPAEAGPSLRQADGGPWLDAPAVADKGWLQAWVRVVTATPAGG